MKILKIKIDGFGKWVNANWQINPGLQTIYGPNEAGKSTLVEFILSVFFGFANGRGKNKFRRYVPRDTEAYGGALLVEHHGQRYWINRKKGSRGAGKVTITDEKGKHAKVSLTDLLGPLNIDLVKNVFCFDQSELSRVGDLTDERVKQSLQQVGAVGSRQWQDQKAAFDDQAQSLYGPRARTRPLNRALNEVDQLTAKLNAAQENNSRYAQLQRELRANQEQLAKVEQELQRAQEEQQQAVKLQRLWPVYEQWQSARAKAHQQWAATDEQIVQLQKLRVREPELQKTVTTKQEQCGRLQGQLQTIDEKQVQDYAKKWRGSNDPRNLLHKFQAATLAHQQQGRQIQSQRDQLDQLQQRYGKPLPQPLSSKEVQELQSLQQQRRSGHQGGAASTTAIVPSVGFLTLLAGFVFSNVVLTLLGFVLVLAGGYLLYRSSEQKKDNTLQRNAITRFGRVHGYANIPVEQWLAIQGELRHGKDVVESIAKFEEEERRLASRQRDWAVRFADVNAASASDFWQQLLDQLDRLEQQYQKWRQLQTQLVTAEGELAHSQEQLSATKNTKVKAFRQLHVANWAEFDNYLKTRAAAIKTGAQVAVTEQQLSAQDRTALQKLGSVERVDQYVADRQEEVSQLMAKQNRLTTDSEAIKVQLDNLVKDGTMTELEQQLANAQAKVQQLLKQYLTFRLTEKWINQALECASADRYPLILKRAINYFRLLTADRYSSIEFNSSGNLMVTSVARQQFDVNELSTGTAEQLYIALRLAFVSVMSDVVEFPLIIDDGFVNFDQLRKQRMVTLLQEIAKDEQVLYLTADDRREELHNAGSVLDLTVS
ncbi:ATP-binding protein [Limosilactobacillus difficilis]|uniref:ATP-binding protein n=1 Tax=Limosilactobacillus difficilis TaxID=2991838 RepID=UPI0024B9A630|nr:AAA family ATPase [Limosilactobacillus difficilis]